MVGEGEGVFSAAAVGGEGDGEVVYGVEDGEGLGVVAVD